MTNEAKTFSPAVGANRMRIAAVCWMAGATWLAFLSIRQPWSKASPHPVDGLAWAVIVVGAAVALFAPNRSLNLMLWWRSNAGRTASNALILLLTWILIVSSFPAPATTGNEISVLLGLALFVMGQMFVSPWLQTVESLDERLDLLEKTPINARPILAQSIGNTIESEGTPRQRERFKELLDRSQPQLGGQLGLD